jgi:hypothetical protein
MIAAVHLITSQKKEFLIIFFHFISNNLIPGLQIMEPSLAKHTIEGEARGRAVADHINVPTAQRNKRQIQNPFHEIMLVMA